MLIQIEVDAQQAKHFVHYLDTLRAKAANDLLRMQREVDVERMTGAVSVLSSISRAFHQAVAIGRPLRKGAVETLAETMNV